MTPLLELQSISLRRGERDLLRDINLRIASAELHVLLGANGAGKSTLVYLLMGCADYTPQSGEIRFAGERLNDLPISERAQRGIALAWQEPARFEGLSVAQFLRAGAADADPAMALAAVGLVPAEYLARPLDKTLSGGERKRIELAGILTLKPRLAILDEPTAGIDLLTLDEILHVIEAIRATGTAVLLITHQESLAGHADTASQLCGGRIVCTGTPNTVIANFKARRCGRCDGERCSHA